MGKIQYVAIGLFLLFSCREHSNQEQHNIVAEFSTSTTSSKASETTWSKGDRIGIFMVQAGLDLTKEHIVAGATNIVYVADKTGAHCYFTPNNTTQTILLPQENTLVDFCAYYPYTEVVYSGFNIPIDVQDQTNLEAIDYMLAKRVVGKSQSDHKVLFTFDHILSLLEITLQGGYGTTRAELEDLSVTICNSKSYGSLSIAQKSVSARNIGEVVTQKAGADLTIEAIAIPQQFDANNYAFLRMLYRGVSYEIPLEFDFIQSKRHQITLLVEDKKIYISQQGVVIKGWDTGAGGDYDFEHKAVADGTKELDPTIFTLDNPHWIVRGVKGGDANQNYTVAANIRKALAALPTDGSANGMIVLEVENLTELPAFEVQGVKKGALEGCVQLKEVVLSSSLRVLDTKAFFGCANLQRIAASGVTTTAESTFEGCTVLVAVDLPLLKTAGNYIFRGCSSLQSVDLPQLTALPIEAFAGSTGLERLSIPAAKKLYDRALSGCVALAELNLTAGGEIKMLVNPFSGFTNSSNCALTLHADKQQAGVGLPLVTIDGKWGPLSKELSWKQIKFE